MVTSVFELVNNINIKHYHHHDHHHHIYKLSNCEKHQNLQGSLYFLADNFKNTKRTTSRLVSNDASDAGPSVDVNIIKIGHLEAEKF